ncbi:DNA-binding transcriptional response regulator [Novosphingobium rosa]|jgi:DNA-binding NtrC family response regulator|uniref:response regulator n=1 Tax=Novosphingobium rosa TaxID=76978 RepID=UPI000829904F|nr:response regulator [Novosphingobium rosa]
MSDENTATHCLIVADGEVLVRNVLAAYLRECGYKVIDAANTDEVVTILQEGADVVQAVLADAGLDGSRNIFDLRLWLREHYPEVEVVLVGNVQAAAKAAGHLCDEGPHLKRPYDPQAVLEHIKRLLAKARK